MKWARYRQGGNVFYGFIEGDMIMPVEGLPYSAGQPGTGRSAKLADVLLLAPCEPSKVVCIGLNYLDHAEEMHFPLPAEPLIFLKPSTAVIGPAATIRYPDISASVHYEAELAVVIKKEAKNVRAADAAAYIFGYTCGNDVSARDLQKKDGQWTRAKSFDTFCPLGPYIETDIGATAAIKAYLNGKTVQDSNIDQLIFKTPELIEAVSKVMTLLPGDVIMTGTSSGVGPMERGDKIEVEIEGIGRLCNSVG